MKFKTPYEKPWGGAMKFITTNTGSWRVQRPVVNVEKCCLCGWCYLYCPSGCMEDKGVYFTPNLDYCKGCGVCAKECPVNAIEMVREGGR